MSDSGIPSRKPDEIPDPFVLSPLDPAAHRGHDMSLEDKVNLLDLRMRSLCSFEVLPFEKFIASLPDLNHLLALLAQSVVGICCSLLLEKTGTVPHSYCDVLSSCKQKRILPAGLIGRLSVQLFLIDKGFNKNDPEETLRRYDQMPETARAFRQFLEHAKGVIAALS